MNLLRKCEWSCLLLLSLMILSCEESTSPEIEKTAGGLIKSELIHNYSAQEMAQVLTTLGLPEVPSVQGSFRAVKLIYYSPDVKGEMQRLSGAIIFPVDDLEHPVLSMQHGTVTRRDEVASVDPLNSSAGITALLTASLGYITLVPDYAGYGDSNDHHPYMHGELLANSVIDMIRAAQRYCDEEDIKRNDQLFLGGYSEGGYATLATQQLMETDYPDEFNLTAVAPMAGPYDLQATARLVLEGSEYTWPAYIGFMFVAYDQIYGLKNLDQVFVAPYNEQITAMYSGNLSFFEINNQLPLGIENLIRSEFRESFLEGTEHVFSDKFIENSLLSWQPNAPLRFIHGTQDATVPYSVAVATVNALVDGGAENVELIGIPGATHETAGMPAVMEMLAWFSTFDSQFGTNLIPI